MSLRELIIPAVDRILATYYGTSHLELILSCLREPDLALGEAGRVLVRTSFETEAVELGLEFGGALSARLNAASAPLRAHDVAVVAEEVSHMNVLIETCLASSAVSHLDLEVLGEIDRFLVLLHWEALTPALPLEARWRNLDELSDTVFTGQRFAQGGDANLYVLAEECAFAHLRRALSRSWENTSPDLSRVDAGARRYLQNLRQGVLAGGRPARYLAQSA